MFDRLKLGSNEQAPVGIIVAFVVSLLGVLASSVALSTTASVHLLISLVLVCVAVLLGAAWDIWRDVRTQKEDISHQLRRLNRMHELREKITECGLSDDEILSLCEKAAEIRDGEVPALALEHAIARITETTGDLDKVKHGRLVLRGEDRDWLKRLTKETTERLQATSLPAVDARFWAEGSDEYMQEQRRALENGVDIRRVFIATADQDDMLREMERQRQLGIYAAFVDESHLQERDIELIEDFIIFDDQFVLVSEPAPAGSRHLIRNTTILFGPHHVRRYQKRFDTIWSLRSRNRNSPNLTDID